MPLPRPLLLLPQRTTIKHFVRKHVVCKSDSLAGLAVRFGTDLATLRRYNNITSDHTLQSRAHLFVPGAPLCTLCGPAERSRLTSSRRPFA